MKPGNLLILAVSVSLLLSCNPSPASLPETIATELAYGRELQDALDNARDETEVVGASAAVIVEGKGMWVGASGDSHPGWPITPGMLFDTGSAGKILMGPLMVKLAEDGLIALDDPISEYLPEFPYADGSITIRQLLNHTSGLYMMVNHPDGPFRKPYADIDHGKWWSIDEIFTALGGQPTQAPGEAYCYTQAGYQISTLIVQEVTGSTAAEQIQARLLDPLEIHDMYLDYSRPLPKHLEIAHPWVDVDRDGRYDDISNRSRNWIASLSRIYYHSSAGDLAVWGHALFTGRVLGQRSMDQMVDFYRTDDWCGDEPFLVGYGMGVMDLNPELTAGEPAWGHLGRIQGYRTFLAHLHQRGVTLVVMTNTDTDDVRPILDGLLDVILDHTGAGTGAPPPLEVEPVVRPPQAATVVDATSREALFCRHTPLHQVETGPEAWIDISLDWIVGTDEARAEEAWRHFASHRITLNGRQINLPAGAIYGPEPYSVACPDEIVEVWSKGLSLYLPPMPGGEYEIVWFSEVNEPFNNGFTDYKAGNYMELITKLTVK